jgi:MFS family permease
MNGFYLSAISGTQMTLLPLLLTNGGTNTAATGMALTATTMGYIYMWMSAVQVLGNPAAGRFADKAGKHTAILAGGVLTSTAMATVPVICVYGLMAGDFVALNPNDINWPLLAAVLGIWSLGGTLLATSHVSNDSQTALALHMHLRKTDVVPITNQVAAISDAVSDSRRSQAIALLRTAGDIGFLLGALSAGLAADLMGDVGFAMQAGSAVLMGATGWFGLQTLALNQLDKKQVK